MENGFLKREFSKNRVQQQYARVAWFYDLWSKLTEKKATERAIELAGIVNGSYVLEVAVGTGMVFECVVKENPDGENVGIDISPAMVQKAERRMGQQSIQNYTLQIADAFNLPFEEEKFDIILNNYMFDLLPEQTFEGILLEFKKVLKPSGKLILVTMGFGNQFYHKFWHWLAKHFPSLLTGCRPVQMSPYLEQVGLSIQTVEEISEHTFPSTVIVAVK